ncbi:hypothetical protein EOD39_14005, partial [Acipenser ruthenus]
TVKNKERENRTAEKKCFNRHHRVQNLSKLNTGSQDWLTDARVPGTVISEHSTPCSYLVYVPQGTLRCNRHHLVPMNPITSDITQNDSQQEQPQVTATVLPSLSAPVNSHPLATTQMRTRSASPTE